MRTRLAVRSELAPNQAYPEHVSRRLLVLVLRCALRHQQQRTQPLMEGRARVEPVKIDIAAIAPVRADPWANGTHH